MWTRPRRVPAAVRGPCRARDSSSRSNFPAPARAVPCRPPAPRGAASGLGQQDAHVACQRVRLERLERDADAAARRACRSAARRPSARSPSRRYGGRGRGRRGRRVGVGVVGAGRRLGRLRRRLVLERAAAGVGGLAARKASAPCGGRERLLAGRVDRGDPVVLPDGPQLVARAEQVAPAPGKPAPLEPVTRALRRVADRVDADDVRDDAVADRRRSRSRCRCPPPGTGRGSSCR